MMKMYISLPLESDLKVPIHLQLGVVDCKMKRNWQHMSI